MKRSNVIGAERNREIEALRDQQVEDLRQLLALPEGRRFLWRLLGECRIYQSPMNPNGSMQAHNIGMGDAGRMLISWLTDVDPKAYPQLMLDHAPEAEKKKPAVEPDEAEGD